MSFKDFLEDLEASEAAAIEAYWQKTAQSPGPTRSNLPYPPTERFRTGRRPNALSGDCNIWGTIPFHGSVLSPLASAGTPEKFDWLHGPLGLSARKMPDVLEFAQDMGRLAFFLVDPAPSYARMEYLEPLIRELKPPHLVTILPEDRISKTSLRGESEAFDDIAGDSIMRYLVGFELARQSVDPMELASHDYANLRQTYVVLRTLGPTELVLETERHVRLEPGRAVRLLEMCKNLLIGPALDRTGMTRVFPADELAASAADASGQLAQNSPETIPYEVGKFVLSSTVMYPETIDGCKRVIEEYDEVELSTVQSALTKAIRSSDVEAINASSLQLTTACTEAWKRASRISVLEKVAGTAPVALFGAIGAAVSGLPGVGVMAALGLAVGDKFLGDRIGSSASSLLLPLLADPSLLTVYDFQKRLPRSLSARGRPR
jgi:hypothetical protein